MSSEPAIIALENFFYLNRAFGTKFWQNFESWGAKICREYVNNFLNLFVTGEIK